MKPYFDLAVTDDEIIREFSDDVDPIELMWHRDDETRIIEAVGETDWMIQLEDQLPTEMTGRILIPRHQWHRAIKGTGKLTLKIKKIQNEI